MIKAGSIVYAIVICVMVGIICYALLLMSSYGRMHQTILFTQTEVLQTNESAKNFFLGKIDELKSTDKAVDILENGMASTAQIQPWGFYNVLYVATNFRQDTIAQTMMIGERQHKNANPLALYLADHNKTLYMVDKAKIVGDAALPKAGIKTGYITSNAYYNKNYLQGSKKVAERTLPIINKQMFVYEQQVDTVAIETIKDTAFYKNDFNKKAKLITSTQTVVSNKKLSGNIVLTATDSIYIRNNNRFEDIIIQAPKVVFEKGFQGTVQVIAEELIALEEEVTLAYPSALLIHKGSADKKEIVIRQKSKVLGGVVLYDKQLRTDKMITIDENAQVVGDVYCNGKVQLKGHVIGTVYADNFFLKTKASAYDNYILDGTINSKALPSYFARIPLLDTKERSNRVYESIKEL